MLNEHPVTCMSAAQSLVKSSFKESPISFTDWCFTNFPSVYSVDGVLVLALLVVCTCAYITKVPRLKSFFLSEKKGFFGVFYKGKIL